MRFTIKSTKHGKVEFSRPGKHYIFIDFDGNRPGTLGQQICDAGHMMGNTMTYSGDSQEQFENICRKWWKAYLRNERKI